jgi:hypothetical protein
VHDCIRKVCAFQLTLCISALADINYEKVCVLYTIAAVHSQLAGLPFLSSLL